jgi:hypothetical protein
MKSFLKLSIAAVLFGAMMLGTSAFAAPVTADSSGKLDVGGIIWANTGYLQPFEQVGTNADGEDELEAPPTTFEVAHESRLNVSWKYNSVTAHWEYWMRRWEGNKTGDVILGWVSWMPSESVVIDMGMAQDPSWSERAVDWETHLAVDGVGAPGAYNYLFPEGSPGTDISFLAGAIKAGIFISAKGLVTGTNTDYAGGNQANTYVAHVEFSQDALWVAVLFGSETMTGAGLDADPTVDVDGDGDPANDGDRRSWSDAEEVANTAMGVSARYSFGPGKVKFQYFMVDGDSFEDDAPTDMAVGLHFNVGEAMAFLEYDLLTNGGKETGLNGDADKVADASYMRVGYKMPIDTNSSLQVEYEMQDNGTSTASAPRVGFVTSF